MANKNLFQSIRGALIPFPDTVNKHYAPAYLYTPKHRLAQYVSTGCLNGTFYATAPEHLDDILKTAKEVDPAFISKAAVYARSRGYMKDTPALLVAMLASRDRELFDRAFNAVIDDARMLRNVVQMLRSGVTGRKSLGTLPKRKVRQWLESKTDEQLFIASVGQSPSLADVIRMVHPIPKTASRRALYGYLVGRDHDASVLPAIVQKYEAFKSGEAETQIPDVPMQMLTALNLSDEQWTAIALRASWQTTRMNLNTYARHGVFQRGHAVQTIASRLSNREAIRKARVFPYQIQAAIQNIDDKVPRVVVDALYDAMEIAVENVPLIKGRVVVCVDVSGSMFTPVTGHRKGATTAVRCVDVAALIAASILRHNRNAIVIPFHDRVVDCRLEARDTIATNAEKLTKIGTGGTNCCAPIAKVVKENIGADLVIMVSDNQSWMDANVMRNGTGMMFWWNELKEKNPAAKLACIDIQPHGTSQAPERSDILNVGGFSDSVFEILRLFSENKLGPQHWVEVIDEMVV